jgi:ribose transport system ATP-binding protein
MSTPLLATSKLTKRYGNVTVLDDVALEIRGGEIHALIGANGAGKSTLCKIISGLTERSAGTMTLEGRPFTPAGKRDAEQHGIQIIQQELNLIPTLSVAENLMFTRLPHRLGLLRQKALHHRAADMLQRFGLGDVDSHQAVGTLGVGRQQMIEIAAALDRRCKLLILDEPTAALSANETEQLFEHLQRLRTEGVGMVYISHRLDEIKQHADRITVLRDGKLVGTFDNHALSTDQMVEKMGGEPARAHAPRIHSKPNRATAKPPALRVERLCSGMVQNVSFQVDQGECFGITGLVGAGRTELLRAIFGADVAQSGTVSLAGQPPTRFTHPSRAVRAGLAMVTEDRKETGLLLDQSIRINTTLNSLTKSFSQFGLIRSGLETRVSEQQVAEMETRCTSVEQPAGTLSGGNQQKVVIAKWLTHGADVFLFDEPTRGIDVAARRRIFSLFHSLTAAGKAIVVVSSDLEELMETCDRIAVMSVGRLVETFDRWNLSEESVLQACFAGHRT